MTYHDKIQKMFDIFFELQHHEATAPIINHLYHSAGNGILFAGIGKNFWLAEKVAATYKSLGMNASALCPVHALHGDIGCVDKQTIFIMSKSGITSELSNFLEYIAYLKSIRHIDPTLIGIFLNNMYVDTNGVFEYIVKPESSEIYEFDSFNIVPSLSISIIQLYIDYIGIQVFESTKDALSEFKLNHPGGNIGKILKDVKGGIQ